MFELFSARKINTIKNQKLRNCILVTLLLLPSKFVALGQHSCMENAFLSFLEFSPSSLLRGFSLSTSCLRIRFSRRNAEISCLTDCLNSSNCRHFRFSTSFFKEASDLKTHVIENRSEHGTAHRKTLWTKPKELILYACLCD